jgi:hypothetical protein
MNASHLNIPWDKVEKGCGFFIPAVDPITMREPVLKSAVRARVWGVVLYGVKNGCMGLLFIRTK